MRNNPLPVLLFAAGILCAASPPEWGQWAGPSRNFHVPARPIAQSWPQSGPRILWKHAMPYGNSSVAVAGNRLYTMYRDTDNEVVIALDAATGTTVWEH